MKGKNKRLWEIKQSTNPSELNMYIYGDVEGDYYDWWNDKDVISETSANHFKEELNKYPDVTNINIYINSYGGSVFEGTAIYSQLKRHAATKTVYVDGFACSIASVIAMAGDKVIMPSNTLMMVHSAMLSAFGNAEQLRKAADNLDVIMEGNKQAYLNKSNGKVSEEELDKMLKIDTWLTAKQCVEYGFADELLEKEVDLTDAQQMLQKANQTLEQQLDYNKALVAQARELALASVIKPIEPEPKEPQEPQEPREEDKPLQNKPLNMMRALFNFKEEE